MSGRDNKYKEICKGLDGFEFKSIDRVNHKPHPYTIGTKHVVYASDHYGGVLGAETCRKIQCAHPGCRTSYEDHTSDQVMFLSLKRDITKEEGQAQLKTIVDAGMEADGIDGVCFVETDKKYRFID